MVDNTFSHSPISLTCQRLGANSIGRFLAPGALFRVFAIGVILLSAITVALATFQPWIDPRWLFLDTQTVGEFRGTCCHAYDGAFSTLGLMIWAATASIAGFAVFVGLAQGRSIRLASMSFCLSAFLALDDAYLLHEVVLPKLGVPQLVVVGMLGLFVLGYLYAGARRFLASRERWILIFSLGALGASLGVDQVLHSISAQIVALEDGLKFIGIVSWFLFHLRVFSWDVITASQESGA